MFVTIFPMYSKEFREKYEDFVYPLKGWEFQNINLETYNMPMPRIGEAISSWPTPDGDEVYDLVVCNIRYEIMHDKNGLFIKNIDTENTYEDGQCRVSIYIKEDKRYAS